MSPASSRTVSCVSKSPRTLTVTSADIGASQEYHTDRYAWNPSTVVDSLGSREALSLLPSTTPDAPKRTSELIKSSLGGACPRAVFPKIRTRTQAKLGCPIFTACPSNLDNLGTNLSVLQKHSLSLIRVLILGPFSGSKRQILARIEVQADHLNESICSQRLPGLSTAM